MITCSAISSLQKSGTFVTITPRRRAASTSISS
jgi:hypothetical protein